MGHPLVSRNTRKITADFDAEEKFRVYSSFNTYIKLTLGGVKQVTQFNQGDLFYER